VNKGFFMLKNFLFICVFFLYTSQGVWASSALVAKGKLDAVLQIITQYILFDVTTYTPLMTSSATVTVEENQTNAITLHATGEGNISYSISGGDSLLFEVNASTGVVRFLESPDYEAIPIKLSYSFIARASNGRYETTQNIVIHISNINDTSSNKRSLGINVEGLNDWTPSLNFLNQFRRARLWISRPSDNSVWDDGRSISMDVNGYVTSLDVNQTVLSILHITTSNESNLSCESGRYELHYEGEGTFTFQGASTLVSHDSTNKTAIVNFDCSTPNYLAFQLLSTNPLDYLKNLTLVHEDYVASFNNGEIFHPRLLESLKDFSVVRFMDWGKINYSTISTWNNRVTPQSYSYAIGDRGVAIEAMIDLANRLDVSPWICVPHRADDAYFMPFATLLKTRLNTSLKFYVEYSNEVWNGIFPQNAFSLLEGVALNLDSNMYLAGQLFHWIQTAKIGEVLHTVFADESTQRFSTVVGSQSSNIWFSQQGYAYLQGINKEHLIDAIAIAPYMGGHLGNPNTANTIATYTADQILDEVEANIPVVMQDVTTYVNDFSSKNIKILGYEGGQHLARVGSTVHDSTLETLFIEANRAERMGALYKSYLDTWDTVSEQEVMLLFISVGGYGQYGSWGLKENDTQSHSPKSDAVQEWILNI
jgi:hypothetical protein